LEVLTKIDVSATGLWLWLYFVVSQNKYHRNREAVLDITRGIGIELKPRTTLWSCPVISLQDKQQYKSG
jgi:hypothetical protein